MVIIPPREALSHSEKLKRSIYEIIRDEIDRYLIDYVLLQSYSNFIQNKQPYPFVKKKELKPRARIPDIEYKYHNACLVIFVEDAIPNICKKYIRFFDINKVNKTNLHNRVSIPCSDMLYRNLKYLDNPNFFDFFQTLLPVDYALLIEGDSGKGKNKYSLTHFHVRVDWPIADAAEDLAKHLRYISKELYEKGDTYAEDIQKKFFEYYGLPVMAGGRRTAAIVAAQFLNQIPCISTIYAGSSETRSLIRISEKGVSKFILMELKKDEIERISSINNLSIQTLTDNYMITKSRNKGLFIFQVSYAPTPYSCPPEDGKLRELNADLFWLTVVSQYILPKNNVLHYPPIQYNVIYN